jgi:chromosome segregation ATPase
MPGDEQGEPVTVPEAARMLGKSLDTIRAALRRGTLAGFKDNKGEWRVYVPESSRHVPDAARQSEADHQVLSVLKHELDHARSRIEALQRQAEERGEALAETRIAQVRAEERAAALREALEREQRRADRLDQELAELRRPWWRKLTGR